MICHCVRHCLENVALQRRGEVTCIRSTLENDAVDKVMPPPNDVEVLPCPGIKTIPTVPEPSVEVCVLPIHFAQL